MRRRGRGEERVEERQDRRIWAADEKDEINTNVS